MKKIIFLVLLPTLLLVPSAQAQRDIPKDVPTPNASDLGRFGDIPVSYYNGQVDLSIPLFKTSVRDVDLELSLRYNSSGILMNSLPGWTGHNWTLNAGGVITRTMETLPDEYKIPERLVGKKIYCYFESYDHLKNNMDILDNNDRLKNTILNNPHDMAPDIFTFNFMGKTGRFFLGADGQWKVDSEDNIDVIFDVTDENNYDYALFKSYPKSNGLIQPKTIKGFTLIDDKGVRYEFGGTQDAIEYSIPFFYMGDAEDAVSWVANSWYLTKVSDRQGNLLFQFDYERGYFVAQFYNTYETYRIQEKIYSNLFHFIAGQTNYYLNGGMPINGILNSPVYLSKITTSNGISVMLNRIPVPITTENLYAMLINRYGFSGENGLNGTTLYSVQPYYYLQTRIREDIVACQYQESGVYKYSRPLSSTRLMSLSSIQITDEKETACKTYAFDYDFNTRMHLSRINIYNCKNWEDNSANSIASYTLVYKDFDKLPSDYLTTAMDHWGYYNGNEHDVKNYNENTLYDLYVIKSVRDPDAVKMQYGMLKKIIYPTGGVSAFEYEPHNFSQYVSEDRQSLIDSIGIAGGLRIKSVTEYEDTTCTTILRKRTFSYLNPITGKSSGQLVAAPRYVWKNWSAQTFNGDKKNTLKLNLFRTSSIIPLSNSFGSHIGYSNVEETEMDGSKTQYAYTNYGEAKDKSPFRYYNSLPTPFDRYSQVDFKRGKIRYVKQYDAQGNLKKTTAYTYRNDDSQIENTRKILTSNYSILAIGNSKTIIGNAYYLYYPKNDISQILETTHTPNGDIVNMTSFQNQDITIDVDYAYGHKSDIRVTKQVTKNRKGHFTKTEYVYPFDVNDLANKLSRNFHNLQPVGINTYKGNTLLASERSYYADIMVNGSLHPMPKLDTKTLANGIVDTTCTYMNYTPTGRLERYKEKGKPEVYLNWIYKDNYLFAKSIGGYWKPLLDIPNNIALNREAVLDHSKYVYNENLGGNMITMYTWHPLYGVTSVTNPQGYTEYYEYDSLFRLTNILNNEKKSLKHYEYNYKNK